MSIKMSSRVRMIFSLGKQKELVQKGLLKMKANGTFEFSKENTEELQQALLREVSDMNRKQ